MLPPYTSNIKTESLIGEDTYSHAEKLMHFQKVFRDPYSAGRLLARPFVPVNITATVKELEEGAHGGEEEGDAVSRRPFQRYQSGSNCETIFLGTLFLRNQLRHLAHVLNRHRWRTIPARYLTALTAHIVKTEASLQHVKKNQLAKLYDRMVADRKELDSFIKDSRGTTAVWTETILSGLAKDLLYWNEGVEDQDETRLIAGQHALSTMVVEPTSCPGEQSSSTANGQGQDTVERGLEVPREYYGKETKEAGGNKGEEDGDGPPGQRHRLLPSSETDVTNQVSFSCSASSTSRTFATTHDSSVNIFPQEHSPTSSSSTLHEPIDNRDSVFAITTRKRKQDGFDPAEQRRQKSFQPSTPSSEVMMEAIKDLSTKWKETDQKADRALEHILEMKVLHGVRQQDNEEKIEMLSKELLELKTVLRAQNAVVFAETKRVNSLSSTVTSLEKVIVRAKEGQQATKGQDEKWMAAVEAAVRQLKSETSDMSNRLADLDD
ncbi:MAG: hypothetical protein J3R72DRAFT_451708, partial [Linnemannia gamsii]